MHLGSRSGFSLVELAIALLVIALLFAGITSGTRLIEQAKLRSVIGEMEEIKVAYHSFIARYDAVPGDMEHASTFFANCATGGIGNVNCNGNGDKLITFNMGDGFNANNIGDESVKFYRHLFLAELFDKAGITALPSNYNSIGDPVNTLYHPVSTAFNKEIGYFVATVDAGSTGGSTLAIGEIYKAASDDTIISNFPINTTGVYVFSTIGDGIGKLSPTQSFTIDKKIDDAQARGSTASGAASGNFRTSNDLSGSDTCVSGNEYLPTNIYATDCIPGMTME